MSSSPVPVPLLDLRAQYEQIRAESEKAIHRVVESQAFILGPEVEAFEQELAAYCQSRFALGVSSGTDALLLSLMALDVGPGDEVITSPYTFFATAGSIARVGARAVFVDIEADTYNIDPSGVEAAVTPRTKAIMPVHLFGQAVEMKPIVDLASARGIPIIEDAAQALGTELLGKRVGGIGTVGCFSFFPSKNLGAFGDAGLVTTDDAALFERLARLRVHGGVRRYYHEEVGGNFRIDALQAAILRVKLPHLDGWSAGRQRNAALYRSLFADAKLLEHVRLPVDRGLGRHIYNQFVIAVPHHRDALQQYLADRKIGTAVYYPLPLHLQQCFHDLGYGEGSFPVAERAAKETLALPIFPELTEHHLATVVQEIKNFFDQHARG